MDHTLLGGKKASRDFMLCTIHVTAERVRDRNDCLWDGAGMRNHHKSNMLMLPALIGTLSGSCMDSTHRCSCWWAHKQHTNISYMCTRKWGGFFRCHLSVVGERKVLCHGKGKNTRLSRPPEVAQDCLNTVWIKWLNKPSMRYLKHLSHAKTVQSS